MLADLVENPWIANGPASDHQAPGLGDGQHGGSGGGRIDIAIGKHGTRQGGRRGGNQLIVHGRAVHAGHRASVHRDKVDPMAGQHREQGGQWCGGIKADPRFDGKPHWRRHRGAQGA